VGYLYQVNSSITLEPPPTTALDSISVQGKFLTLPFRKLNLIGKNNNQTETTPSGFRPLNSGGEEDNEEDEYYEGGDNGGGGGGGGGGVGGGEALLLFAPDDG